MSHCCSLGDHFAHLVFQLVCDLDILVSCSSGAHSIRRRSPQLQHADLLCLLRTAQRFGRFRMAHLVRIPFYIISGSKLTVIFRVVLSLMLVAVIVRGIIVGRRGEGVNATTPMVEVWVKGEREEIPKVWQFVWNCCPFRIAFFLLPCSTYFSISMLLPIVLFILPRVIFVVKNLYRCQYNSWAIWTKGYKSNRAIMNEPVIRIGSHRWLSLSLRNLVYKVRLNSNLALSYKPPWRLRLGLNMRLVHSALVFTFMLVLYLSALLHSMHWRWFAWWHPWYKLSLVTFFFSPLSDIDWWIDEHDSYHTTCETGSVLYAHYIDFWGYNKFDHPESYGLAREYFNLSMHSTTLIISN